MLVKELAMLERELLLTKLVGLKFFEKGEFIMKRIFQTITMMVLISVLTINVKAAVDDQDSIYEERKQIILRDSVASNVIMFEKEDEQVLDSEIKKILESSSDNGIVPVAIGWTTVHLKEVEDANGNLQYVPMTTSEVEESKIEIMPFSSSGKPTVKGNFTLYTLVGYDNYDPTALFAESIGEWSVGSGTSNGTHVASDDFITMTWPKNYTLKSSSLLGAFSGSYKKDEAYKSVVWGFGEKKGTVTLMTNGINDGSTGTRKWISKYVHTWEKTVPTFSFSATDVGISLTDSDASWQISSSLIY